MVQFDADHSLEPCQSVCCADPPGFDPWLSLRSCLLACAPTQTSPIFQLLMHVLTAHSALGRTNTSCFTTLLLRKCEARCQDHWRALVWAATICAACRGARCNAFVSRACTDGPQDVVLLSRAQGLLPVCAHMLGVCLAWFDLNVAYGPRNGLCSPLPGTHTCTTFTDMLCMRSK